MTNTAYNSSLEEVREVLKKQEIPFYNDLVKATEIEEDVYNLTFNILGNTVDFEYDATYNKGDLIQDLISNLDLYKNVDLTALNAILPEDFEIDYEDTYTEEDYDVLRLILNNKITYKDYYYSDYSTSRGFIDSVAEDIAEKVKNKDFYGDINPVNTPDEWIDSLELAFKGF